MEDRALVFVVSVSVASFLNAWRKSCFRMLITAVCISTILSLSCDELFSFCRGMGDVCRLLHGRKDTVHGSECLPIWTERVRSLVTCKISQLAKLRSYSIPFFFFEKVLFPGTLYHLMSTTFLLPVNPMLQCWVTACTKEFPMNAMPSEPSQGAVIITKSFPFYIQGMSLGFRTTRA